MWFKNGVRLHPSARHQVSHSSQIATLKIASVGADDAGHYTLFAENPSGRIVSTAYLAVEPAGPAAAPALKRSASAVSNGDEQRSPRPK